MGFNVTYFLNRAAKDKCQACGFETDKKFKQKQLKTLRKLKQWQRLIEFKTNEEICFSWCLCLHKHLTTTIKCSCSQTNQIITLLRVGGGVTNLFGSSVEASWGQLSLTEPPAQQVGVQPVQLAGERQEAGTAVNLTGRQKHSSCYCWPLRGLGPS